MSLEDQAREGTLENIKEFLINTVRFIFEEETNGAEIETARVALMLLVDLLNEDEVREAVVKASADYIERQTKDNGSDFGYGLYVAINALLNIRPDNVRKMGIKEANA